jgi:hypothetical protein
MPCDVGRLRSVLEFVMKTGRAGSNPHFHPGRAIAIDGALRRDAHLIQVGVETALDGGDDSAFHVVVECVRESPSTVVNEAQPFIPRARRRRCATVSPLRVMDDETFDLMDRIAESVDRPATLRTSAEDMKQLLCKKYGVKKHCGGVVA